MILVTGLLTHGREQPSLIIEAPIAKPLDAARDLGTTSSLFFGRAIWLIGRVPEGMACNKTPYIAKSGLDGDPDGLLLSEYPYSFREGP